MSIPRKAIGSFDTARDVFRGADNPLAVEKDARTVSIAHGETIFFAFVPGCIENPEAEKWESPSVITARPCMVL